jgi:hypothetical protein
VISNGTSPIGPPMAATPALSRATGKVEAQASDKKPTPTTIGSCIVSVR